ncbi:MULTISPECIES: hypothetical protein [unclassified Moorena]|uniref:hypothetical protein n=1 Tax=unclassified Moorena TaxID=2683338 RepID=UPI00140108FD|nr:MULTISPECIES: hypothetical protein [unclassified Moorena]NEO12388.1 hypothetical protein [Moorena sp. SIO3E8]NEP97545.1 hypothetical protein [Moorena sp. SIO3F7]
MQRCIAFSIRLLKVEYFLLLSIPYSRFPIPDSRFPIPDSLLPTPYSLLPTPLG